MKNKSWLALIFAVVLLGACGASLEEQSDEIIAAVQEEFSAEPDKANHENEDLAYHVPFGIEKEEESPNNILLKNGARTYILFYNQHEEKNSDVVYQTTLKQHENWDINHTFDEDGKLGFLLVKELEEDRYYVVSGVGGIKVTTETKNVKTDAAYMMNIANSGKFK